MKCTLLFSLILFCGSLLAQKPIQVEQQGEGQPILFLPGFTSPGQVWEETISHLPDHYQSHTVSYAGFHGLEPVGTPWYSAIRDELMAYIQAVPNREWTIIGHSMGGNLAVELAAAIPDQVTGLILVDALPCMRALMMPGTPADQIQYQSPYNDQMIAMTNDQLKEVALGIAANMTNQPDKIQQLVEWTLTADRKTYVYGYTDLLKLDLRPNLQKITAKTLILGTSFPSREITSQTFQQQYANLINKEIELVDDSKHFIMFDQPEWLHDQINSYLQKNGH